MASSTARLTIWPDGLRHERLSTAALRLRSSLFTQTFLIPSRRLRRDLSAQSGTGNGLQRLTQSLFELATIGSADSRSRTVLQDHFKLAMRDRLQPQDALDIDNSRTMDADKPNGIEPVCKLVQRDPVQQFLPSDVQVRVNTSSEIQ